MISRVNRAAGSLLKPSTAVLKRTFGRLQCACFAEEKKELEVTTHNASKENGIAGKDTKFDDVLKVYLVPNGEFKENAYILYDSTICEGSVIDPGVESYKLLKAIEKCQVNITSIFLTHAHKHHCLCVSELVSNFGEMPIYMNENDKQLYETCMKESSRSFSEQRFSFVKDQDTVDVANHKGTAIFTPGHTPGSMCYLFGGFLFSGDTLMCNQLGALHPESDEEQMKQSIQAKLFSLPRETMVMGGHGPFSSIATEYFYNPVIGTKAKKACLCFLRTNTSMISVTSVISFSSPMRSTHVVG